MLSLRRENKINHDHILKDLESDDYNLISRGLKLSCVVDSCWQDKPLIQKIFQLLFHERYSLRDKVSEVLKFFIQMDSFSDQFLGELLLNVLGNPDFSIESWFRCGKLYTLLYSKPIPTEKIIQILDSEGNYFQGFITFLMRINKEYGSSLDEIIDYFEKKELEIISDTKKSFLWIFWHNQSFITPRVINLISRLTEDEDREVRRIACEILSQFANDPKYSAEILETLEKRIVDDSWRVQRVAIKCLLQSTQNLYQEDQSFWIKTVGLFWNTNTLVRKNICETLPFWITITEEKNKIFLEMMVTALSDENWEVRESSAISLNKFLNLEIQYNEIAYSIMNLTDDLHPEVRKISCRIISSIINAFENKNELELRIIELLQDSYLLVRKEAIISLNKLIDVTNLDKFYDIILKILIKLLIDPNIEVREEAWKFLVKLKPKLRDTHVRNVISSIIDFQKTLDDDIKLNICVFFIKSKKLIFERKSSIFSFLTPFLADENQEVLAHSWSLCREVFPEEIRLFILNLGNNLSILPPKILHQVYLSSDKLNMLKSDHNLRSKTLKRLESNDEGDEHSIILKIFSNYSDNYITPKVIIGLVNQGRWDVQIACVPFIIRYIGKNNENDVKGKEFLHIIYDLIQNPLDKFQSSEPENITELIADLDKSFQSENVKEFLNPDNDDQRLKAWIALERKFDFLQKIEHPKYNDLFEEFKQSILAELRKKVRTLNLTEVFGFEDETTILRDIVHSMHLQQSFFREKLLQEIKDSLDLSNPKLKHLQRTIINNLLSDPVLRIRIISWEILLNAIPSSDESQFSNEISLFVDLLDSKFEDTQIKAFSILLSKTEITQTANEWIFERMIEKITDPSYFVRNEVWNILKNKINLSYPRYNPLKLKILNLMTSKNLAIRKEAYQFFDLKFDVFSELIDKYSHSYIIKHSIATILGQKGDYKAALELFRANINNRPKKLDSWLGIALIHISRNEIQNALKLLKELQTKNPLESATYELLLECAIDLKDQKLIKVYEEQIRLLKIL